MAAIKNELFSFNQDIIAFMKKTNICITRAGASTLAELNFLNISHIAIPLPTAKDNHQFENALFYNQLGCNWILNENETNTASLMNKLVNIIPKFLSEINNFSRREVTSFAYLSIEKILGYSKSDCIIHSNQ